MSSSRDRYSGDRDVLEQRTRSFAEALNRLDADAIADLLADGVRYESQSVLEPLIGRVTVAEYLREKFVTIARVGSLLRVETGRVSRTAGQTQPCAIAHQDGQRVALYLLRLDADGRIASIDITTAAPHPSEAVGSGEFPGMGLLDPQAEWLARQQPLPRDSLIRFHGFVLSDEMEPRVSRLLRMLAGYYPCTGTEIHLHDRDAARAGSPEWEAIHDSSRRFSVWAYPAVAAEADGRLLFDGGYSLDFVQLRERLRGLIEPPPYARQATEHAGGERFPDGTPACIDCFEGDYEFLSNYFPAPVCYEGLRYPSVENAFQTAKTLDGDVREDFRYCSADGAKRRGRRVALRPDWEDCRVSVMRELLETKFRDPDLRGRLLATGDALLVEGNWWGDQFWGVSRDRGENWLGRILMELRGGSQ